MRKKIIAIIISLLIILGAIAGGLFYYFKYVNVQQTYNADEDDRLSPEEVQWEVEHLDINKFPKHKIPADIKDSSKKYDVFYNIFGSDKMMFVYGYEKGSKQENISEKFHKNIQKKIKKSKLNKKYEVITISNPEKIVNEVLNKNNIILDGDKPQCQIENSDFNKVMNVIDTISGCYYGVCMINPEKSEYINVSKIYPDIIIKIMEEYK